MFFRIKKSGHRAYVQVVENKRFDGAVRQSVIANLGRADDLIASGALASLLASGAKFTDQVLLITTLDEDSDGSLSVAAKRIGGPLLFGRIWERLGIADVLGELLKHRAFEFAVERAVFVGTLHGFSFLGRIGLARRGWRTTTSPVSKVSTFTISIARWLGSGRNWRLRCIGDLPAQYRKTLRSWALQDPAINPESCQLFLSQIWQAESRRPNPILQS